ncbi:zinc transport system substrate-binding protein [Tistlia consotensis]|uniref:High-affinity zinc uptake system protein ZnuA n=1 Tax=Tistlia consotensis USBA 355 TaxID=560819 RepID=A0A1Y6C9U3_9PROT|nr:zinc ABC transporter substrate-binding protein [Tistlia consotensis]SMF53469.1 zinc transport system substrate-binding protein [Tistlia consotensis USBA 355]SNR85564.1 zinc transport system substrate-binding protein [Tistlia consotensis]
MAVLRPLAAAAILLSGFLLAPGTAAAAPPRVVATIEPLHSLVAAVMAGVGEPMLLVPGGASPHVYSIKPSEAEALQHADLVVWVGPALEHFLEDSLDSLAPKARRVEALEVPGVKLRKARAGGSWEPDDDEPAGSGHESDVDPHLWLDPQNAERIVEAVAAALTELDPQDAAAYKANAGKTVAGLERLRAELARQLAPVAGRPFIVFHDAYGYFEQAFGLTAVGSVTVSPEQTPSARRVAELRAKIGRLGAICLFREPQFTPRLVETLAGGTGARVGVLDPLGADLTPGPDAYPALLRQLANSLTGCLGGTG